MPPTTPQSPQKPSQPVSPANQPAGLPAGFGANIGNLQNQQQIQKQAVKNANSKMTLILLIVAVIALIGASAFAAYQSSQLAKAKQANALQYDSGYTAGSEAQKKKDEDAATAASLSDTKTYTAPKELGEFNLAVPKNFSVSTTPGTSKDKIVVLANPDQVDTKADYLALRVIYRQETFAKVREDYDSLAKSKRNNFKTGEDIQVDGRKAVRYTGQIDRREKLGTIVIVEVRDSTIIFQTDNNDNATLLAAYNAAVQSARIP
ncbi:hypothetical protein IT414_00030 [bacterium]|nr:hypothetical protein [bacterium]